MKKRYYHIDAIEALAIFFVVYYHTKLCYQNFMADNCVGYMSYLYYIRYFFQTIVSTCVPLFFFSNGYLLLSAPYSFNKHVNRMARLFILPFFGLLLLPVYMLIRKVPFDLKFIVNSWLNMNSDWGMNRFWFIGALICVYIFFPALKVLFDYDEKSFLLLTGILFITTFGVNLVNIGLGFENAQISVFPDKFNYPMIDMFIPIKKWGHSFVYFCVGGLAYRYESVILQKKAKIRNRIAIISIVISCLILFFVGVLYSKIVVGSLWDIVYKGYDTIPTFINTIALYMLSLNIATPNFMIEIISMDTIWIYMLHTLIIIATKPLFPSNIIFSSIPFNIAYSLAVVLTCTLIAEIYRRIKNANQSA